MGGDLVVDLVLAGAFRGPTYACKTPTWSIYKPERRMIGKLNLVYGGFNGSSAED
jgi:hypothetical protein